MANDAAQAAERAAAAQKQVDFNIDVTQLRAEEKPDMGRTKIRRASLRASERFEPVDENLAETATATVANYRSHFTDDAFDNAVATLQKQDLREDLSRGIKELAAKFGKTSKGPAYPGKPFTHELKDRVPALIGEEDFAELAAENPSALFQETKLVYFAAAQLQEQVDMLHDLHLAQGENLLLLRQWADYFADKVEAADHSEEALMTEIEELQEQIKTKDAAISELYERNRQLSSTPQTDRTTTEGKRSAKIPDPAVFDNSTDDDNGATFDAWYNAMNDKLSVNADHFSSDQARLAYIKGRLGKEVMTSLLPHLSPDFPEQITTSEDLLKHLRLEYTDPNKEAHARAEWKALDMKASGEDFVTFKNRFVRLAGQNKIPRSQWKEEFKNVVTPRFKYALINQFLDPAMSFNDLVKRGQEIAFDFKKDAEASKKKEAEKKASQPKKKEAFTRSTNNKDSAAKPDSTRPRRTELSREELKKYIAEGRCFGCHQTGHTKKECPNKADTQAAREARINEIAERITSNRSRLDEDNEEENETKN